MDTTQAREDLNTLLAILPESIREHLLSLGDEADLLEIVMDLGRVPTARFLSGEKVIREVEVSREEIDQVVQGIGDFDDDNRAGIARTLHRISGIRNRRGQVVGLTLRIGRAVYGTIDIIKDVIDEGHSILILGRPGVGKTTMLREMARILAEKKRVVIVDTSNEIGGDGDIPHPAVGRARRMQVPRPSHQHETMIEAVENHNPEVIVIDEIGREREAEAARTINERGVQLIGTAHGNTLENLLLNPTLSDLVGGIESVTLSDEEARRRGTQKTVLERRSPPTFDVLMEIQDREHLLVHRDVTDAVDRMLRGEPLPVEQRFRNKHGEIRSELQMLVSSSPAVTGRRGGRGLGGGREGGAPREASARSETNGRVVVKSGTRPSGKGQPIRSKPSPPPLPEPDTNGRTFMSIEQAVQIEKENERRDEAEQRRLKVFAYGVARNRLLTAAKQANTQIVLVDNLSEADVLVTLKSYYRKRRRLISDAEQRRTPVYVLRANTVSQMERFLIEALDLEVVPTDPFEEATSEVQRAIDLVKAGTPSVDLEPAGSAVRRYQHQMARRANLVSHSYGREPTRRVRIFSTQRNY